MTTPRCGRCGRVLKDPVSIAMGMGRECRGAKPSRRQASHTRKVAWGQAYTERTPIVFSSTTFTPADSDTWQDEKTGRLIPHDRMGSWLKSNNLIILPVDVQAEMRARRDAILSAFAVIHFTPAESDELYRELAELTARIEPDFEDVSDARREIRTQEAAHAN